MWPKAVASPQKHRAGKGDENTNMGMIIACYRPITIKTKKDAKKFLDSFSGTLYIMDAGGYDMEIHQDIAKDGTVKGVNVSFRDVSQRGSIFNPYFQASDPVGAIWSFRKYVNAQIRSKD